MTIRSGLPLALALCLGTAPAMAQDAIVVEGDRLETADIRSQARDITVGSRSAHNPLPRFQRPVCPGVWGLSEDNAQAVIDRLAANAASAGISVSEEAGCGANVWIIVVDDASATFTRLRDEDSFLTRHLTPYQIRQVREDDSAALGWNLSTTRNPDTGQRVANGFEGAEGALNNLAQGERDEPPANEVFSSSRLDLGVRSDLELSVLLVERRAIGELDSHALADYATMRLLAYTEPPSRGVPVPTILTLFTPGTESAAPQRMTVFDRAYLRGLYRSHPTRPARLAIGNITALMEQVEPLPE